MLCVREVLVDAWPGVSQCKPTYVIYVNGSLVLQWPLGPGRHLRNAKEFGHALVFLCNLSKSLLLEPAL